MNNPRHPIRELLARYKTVFQHAWAHRAELAGPARHASELAFLPAALAFAEGWRLTGGGVTSDSRQALRPASGASAVPLA